MSRDVVKQELLAKLKQEHCFWSYNENSIKDIPDDMLIEKTVSNLSFQENQAGVAGLSCSPSGISLHVESFLRMVLFQGKEARCLYKVYGYSPP